jgi:hypothetical protein
MEQAQEKNLKTPPESDPRKENRNLRAGSETVPGPEDFDGGGGCGVGEDGL